MLQDRIDMRETGLWTIAHGNRHGAVEMDNRRRLNSHQLVIKRNNLPPVGRSGRLVVAMAGLGPIPRRRDVADRDRDDPIGIPGHERILRIALAEPGDRVLVALVIVGPDVEITRRGVEPEALELADDRLVVRPAAGQLGGPFDGGLQHVQRDVRAFGLEVRILAVALVILLDDRFVVGPLVAAGVREMVVAVAAGAIAALAAELADGLRAQRTLEVDGQNLSAEEYTAILRNLLRRVEADFRSGVLDHTSAFNQALNDDAAGDLARREQVVQYLSMRFDLPLSQADVVEERGENAELVTEATAQEPALSAAPSIPEEMPSATVAPILSAAQISALEQAAKAVDPKRRKAVVRPTGTMRVLVVAPSDVVDERQRVARTLEKINADAGQRVSVTLALADDPAEALKQATWDLAIGILWLRFDLDGAMQPALGTEDDFRSAFRESQSSKGGWPRIILCRCTRAPLDILSFDTTQYARVQQFFQSVEASKSLRVPIQHFAHADGGPAHDHAQHTVVAGRTADVLQSPIQFLKREVLYFCHGVTSTRFPSRRPRYRFWHYRYPERRRCPGRPSG